MNALKVTVVLQMNHRSSFGRSVVAETIIHNFFDFRGVASFSCCFNFLVTVITMNEQTICANFLIALH